MAGMLKRALLFFLAILFVAAAGAAVFIFVVKRPPQIETPPVSVLESPPAPAPATVPKAVSATSTKARIEPLPPPPPKLAAEAVPPPAAATTTVVLQLADPAILAETPVDVETVVLVRCEFRSQYFNVSSQPQEEVHYTLGSGVIISPSGYVLTAAHVLEPDPDFVNDPAGRKWSRQDCKAALTDKNKQEIAAFAEDSFWAAEIIFEPSAEEYREAMGLDFAILKAAAGRDLKPVRLAPELWGLKMGENLIILGYPGKIVAVPQQLERLDLRAELLSFFEEAGCKEVTDICGWRYFGVRPRSEYESLFGKKTEIGVITENFRPGFSGGPAFYKGHVIGIVTHGKNWRIAKSGNDEAIVLALRDVFGKLKERNLFAVIFGSN